MSRIVDRAEVRRLLEQESAQLVDVLPRDEYEEEHISGAVTLPLKRLNAASAKTLDRNRPVIVYCNDFQWDLAPRAAARLESLGFARVFEYKGGKQDWLASGLPAEGRRAAEPTIAAVLHPDVPRFGLDDRTGAIVDTMRAAGWQWAAVVDAQGVLLGRIKASDLYDVHAKARDVMEEGPGTYRPNVGLDELLRRMLDHRFDMAFVTDPDGRLRGLVTRRDIARALEAHRKAS